MPAKPEVVVAANGGSDLVYLPTGDKALAAKVVDASLSAQDYVSGLFVDDALGNDPGHAAALGDRAEGHGGHADARHRGQLPHLLDRLRRSRRPAASKSPTPACSRARACTAASRAPTRATSWAPPARASASTSRTRRRRATPIIGKTIAAIARPQHPGQGQAGRPRADRGDAERRDAACRATGGPALGAGRGRAGHRGADQTVGETRYFDAAGYPGRTLGLPVEVEQ